MISITQVNIFIYTYLYHFYQFLCKYLLKILDLYFKSSIHFFLGLVRNHEKVILKKIKHLQFKRDPRLKLSQSVTSISSLKKSTYTGISCEGRSQTEHLITHFFLKGQMNRNGRLNNTRVDAFRSFILKEMMFTQRYKNYFFVCVLIKTKTF